MGKAKILYAASTASHLRRFHAPYIKALRAEHDVYLMGSAGEGIDFPIPFAKSIFSFANVRAVFAVRKILKRERFDRVIVHTTLAACILRAAMIGMHRRPRVLNVVHGYLFPEEGGGLKNRLMLLCEKLLRCKTDELAVMNREDYRIASRHRLCRTGEISFLWGMGMPEPVKELRRSRELRTAYAAKDEILCSFVGELSRRKNQIFLIRAVATLRGEGIPVKLLLPGEGSERETLEAEIDRLGLGGIVFLPGNLEPIHPYLAVTDIYVSASRSEGLPFNVMEAMSLGLPVLMSDVKGQKDLHQNEFSRLYPAEDADAFCKAFRALYREGRLGVGACRYPHLERYRLSSVFEQNLAVLKGENEQ